MYICAQKAKKYLDKHSLSCYNSPALSKNTWRNSSAGESIRFIPGRSLVQIRLPLPGPLVKRLRHRPFTAKAWVRFPYGSPINRHLIRGAGLLLSCRSNPAAEPLWVRICPAERRPPRETAARGRIFANGEIPGRFNTIAFPNGDFSNHLTKGQENHKQNGELLPIGSGSPFLYLL